MHKDHNFGSVVALSDRDGNIVKELTTMHGVKNLTLRGQQKELT